MKMFLRLTLLILLMLLHACSSHNIVVSNHSDDISILAVVNPAFSRFSHNQIKINGSASVHNATRMPQYYGNEFLLLHMNEHSSSRTYYDSIASMTIDFAPVVVKPGSSLSLPVYWVFPSEHAGPSNRFSLVFDQRGLRKQLTNLCPDPL